MYPDLDEFSAPFFLFVNSDQCWKCRQSCRVAGLASAESGKHNHSAEPFMLSNIKSMPEALLAAIRQIQPRYELRTSRTIGVSYFMNLCSCGAHFGDHFLYSKPEGAFFLMDKKDAAKIDVYQLPIEGRRKIECSYGLGTGAIILKHGNRVTFPQ